MISSAVVKVGRSNSPTATRLTSAPIASYCANSSAPVHRPMATSSRAVATIGSRSNDARTSSVDRYPASASVPAWPR